MFGKDPPELGLAEDEGLGHEHRKKGESCAFAESLDHALALLGRAAVVRHQKGSTPEPIAQGTRLPGDWAEIAEISQRGGG